MTSHSAVSVFTPSLPAHPTNGRQAIAVAEVDPRKMAVVRRLAPAQRFEQM